MNILTDAQGCARYCKYGERYYDFIGDVKTCEHGRVWYCWKASGGRRAYRFSEWHRIGPIRSPWKWRAYQRAMEAKDGQ